jgi:hypothetical protein
MVRERSLGMVHEATARPVSKLTTVGRLGPNAYRAHDSTFGDCVLTLADPNELTRRRRVLRKLDHPLTRSDLGVVAVPDHGPGLVTTYLPGVPLSKVDRRRTLNRPREAIRIGVGVLDVLAHAHERGVVHGRLAPRHVIVMNDSTGLVGFGQSPERATTHGDFLALAAILYELVTGEPWDRWAPRASRLRPELGRALDDWLASVADPERSFRNAEHVQSALRAVGATMPLPRRTRSWF